MPATRIPAPSINLSTVNVVHTDVDVVATKNIQAIDAAAAVSVALPDDANPGFQFTVNANGGAVTVTSAYAINGGAVVSDLTSAIYSLVRLSAPDQAAVFEWNRVGDASSSSFNIASRIGILPVTLAGETTFTVTPAMLLNPTYPGARYEGITFGGAGDTDGTRVVLPKPATFDDCYSIIVENLSDSPPANLLFSNDPTTGGTMPIVNFKDNELTLEEEIVNYVSLSSDANTYRAWLLVTPNGVYLTPGFSAAGG